MTPDEIARLRALNYQLTNGRWAYSLEYISRIFPPGADIHTALPRALDEIERLRKQIADDAAKDE